MINMNNIVAENQDINNQIDNYKRTLLRYYNIYLTSKNDDFAEGMAEACTGCLDQIDFLQDSLNERINNNIN